MNLKNALLFVGFSFCTGVAFAGTVTINPPPPDLELLSNDWTLKHGDPPKVLTSTERDIYVNISPKAGQTIIGMESITHSPQPTGVLSNQTSCRVNQNEGFAVTIELVGVNTVTCKAGDYKLNQQKAVAGVKSADVVVTYSKIPRAD
ncbi:hypothetical protein ACYZT9_02040 [Pseudomonas sp. ZT5P21]